MPIATKETLTKLNETVSIWIANSIAGKTHKPIIQPILGEESYFLDDVVLSNENSKVQLTLRYSDHEGEQYEMSLADSKWRGDEIMSIRSNRILFAESGEMGFIAPGEPK